MPKKKNAVTRMSVADVQKAIGLSSREGTYKRLRAAGVKIIREDFGPGTKGFINRKDLKKVTGPRQSWKRKVNAAES